MTFWSQKTVELSSNVQFCLKKKSLQWFELHEASSHRTHFGLVQTLSITLFKLWIKA